MSTTSPRREKTLPPPPPVDKDHNRSIGMSSSSSIASSSRAASGSGGSGGSGIDTPTSGIISVPGSWTHSPVASSSQSRTSMEGPAAGPHDALSPSTSSASSSSSMPLSWPPATFAPSHPSFDPIREHADPFENPFDPRRDSSSSDDYRSSRQDSFSDPLESTPTLPDPLDDMRRGSVTMIPHQPRAVTDPALFNGLAPDSELAFQPMDGFDFSSDDQPVPPAFNRTFSAPLPQRLGYLRHPLSPTSDPLHGHSAHPPRQATVPHTFSALGFPPGVPSHSHSTDTTPSDMIATPIQTLSVELADSLQSAIQTLLHLSPPHLLDNAKEQYSGCTVQMPTTSLSALLTSMRSLNYFSANIQSLVHGSAEEGLLAAAGAKRKEDFDVGELLQSVADLLSGQAAQSGVDLVLFHGDVEIKHVNVDGDGEGLCYLLSHIIRQILVVAKKGDTIELGLQVIPQSPSMTPKVALPLSAEGANRTKGPSVPGRTITPGGSDGPMLCIFEIVHNIYQSVESAATTPKAELNPFMNLNEQRRGALPNLDTILCRRLLQHQNASLKIDTKPSSPLGSGLPRRAYELTVLLPRGKPLVEPAPLSSEEEAMRQPFTHMRLAREPTLPELANFAESLRGKRVVLHASLSSVFARHLTSYLGAWGMDVFHMPMEEVEEEPDRPTLSSSPKISVTSTVPAMSLEPPAGGPAGSASRFVIIDDDVSVLRRELLKARTESSLTKPRLTKRPTLTSRTRSSPLIRPTPKSPVIIIHFTSIANYNHVRDVVASYITSPGSSPEVMVIPKPVGPRRFLTALHTAVHQPVVDPYFSPIATSPRSPGGGYFAGTARTPSGTESREGFFDTIMEASAPVSESGSTKARSPLAEHPPKSLQTPADMISTPAAEYFSNAVRGSSSGSAVVMQSPDGRPVGMFFEPPNKSERRASSNRLTREGKKTPSRKTSLNMDPIPDKEHASPSAPRRPSGPEEKLGSRRSSTKSSTSDPPATRKPKSRKSTMTNAPEPLIAQGRERSGTITKRKGATPAVTPPATEDPVTVFSPSKANKKAALPELGDIHRLPIPAKKAVPIEEMVVPPINVLIVEDNPINQNILSMFLRKKKIKHQSAKDGLEAVEKWRTGGFHLILMDIQLPVMDGITATKEIRQLEKHNNIGVFPNTPVSEHPRPLATPNNEVPSTPLRSSVIIVALTASSLQSDRVSALAAGCNDFLTKPVSLKWLERKIVEWGCMQALIDFDGWRRWKSADPKDSSNETKRGFQTGPQAAAKTLAERLRINPDRKTPKPGLPTSPAPPSLGPNIEIQSATPEPGHKSLPPIRTTPSPASTGGGGVSIDPGPPSSIQSPAPAEAMIAAKAMEEKERQDAAESLEQARSDLQDNPAVSEVLSPTTPPTPTPTTSAAIAATAPSSPGTGTGAGQAAGSFTPGMTRHTSTPASKGGTPDLTSIAEAKESPLRKTVELLEQQADEMVAKQSLEAGSQEAEAGKGRERVNGGEAGVVGKLDGGSGKLYGGLSPNGERTQQGSPPVTRKVSSEKPLPAIPPA